jgi:outer membrane protein
MKKILYCLLLSLSISVYVNAQTEKGDWLAGGSLSLNTTEGATSFSFNPNIGYFFAKGFAAGAELNISTAKLGEIKQTSLGVGPFARYYFELKEPTFKPYAHVGFNIASVRTKAFGESETETATGFLLGLGGAYFINNNVAIDGLAGYNHTKVENTDGNGGFLFRIGFQVHLLGSEVGIRK